jgi:hypothetical protein
MQAREIHVAAEMLLGQPLRWSSVKGVLSHPHPGAGARAGDALVLAEAPAW